MNNSYKTFEVWADEKGWFKVSQASSYASWVSPEGKVVALKITGDRIDYAEELVNSES